MRLLTGRENTIGGMGSGARKESTETISHGVHGLWKAWGYFRGDVNRHNRMSLCSSDKMTDEGQTKPNPRLETRHSKEQRYGSVHGGGGCKRLRKSSKTGKVAQILPPLRKGPWKQEWEDTKSEWQRQGEQQRVTTPATATAQKCVPQT